MGEELNKDGFKFALAFGALNDYLKTPQDLDKLGNYVVYLE